MTAVCLLAASSLVAACGVHHRNVADANNNGTYVHAGPVVYQLQISRLLNPYIVPDSEYLAGLPKNEATLTPNQMWFGVFMWATNTTRQPQQTTDNFDIVDTEGNKYYPVHLNNPYAWTSQTIQPGGTEPAPNTTASFAPTGGRLLLFKVLGSGTNNVYDNRPLTLQIRGNTGKVWATISLDL